MLAEHPQKNPEVCDLLCNRQQPSAEETVVGCAISNVGSESKLTVEVTGERFRSPLNSRRN
jgi:hypothetical protein